MDLSEAEVEAVNVKRSWQYESIDGPTKSTKKWKGIHVHSKCSPEWLAKAKESQRRILEARNA
jgi:hypothetical protein